MASKTEQAAKLAAEKEAAEAAAKTAADAAVSNGGKAAVEVSASIPETGSAVRKVSGNLGTLGIGFLCASVSVYAAALAYVQFRDVLATGAKVVANQ